MGLSNASKNIFLAILVDSYADVKREASAARTLPAELSDHAMHELKRVVRFLRIAQSDFVTDMELKRALEVRCTKSQPTS